MGPKTILMVVNCRGWAWDHKAQNLKRIMAGYGINSDIVYMYDVVPDPRKQGFDTGKQLYKKVHYDNYDTVLMFSLLLTPIFNENLDYSKTFIGITSHMSYSGEASKTEDINLLNKFRGVFVVNQILYQQFVGKIKNLFYCPNGVDTDFFYPKTDINQNGDLRIGWVGDTYHPADKGFFDYVQPLGDLTGVKLSIADSEMLYRPYSEMPDFYNSIDLYICASLSEGTPNPCLEALSCGRPVITTHVGNMPEIIINGINGYLLTRDYQEIQNKVEYIRDNRPLLQTMGISARNAMSTWSWNQQVKNYIAMITS